MHISERYFCQGRNLAVRFPRFDFPVFSVGNICRYVKYSSLSKAHSMSNQLGKFNELWWLSWHQAFREFSRQPIKIKRKCYRIKGLKLTQTYLTPVRLFTPTWLDCYKNKGTWHPNLDVLLPTRRRKSTYYIWHEDKRLWHKRRLCSPSPEKGSNIPAILFTEKMPGWLLKKPTNGDGC